jgi:hypothetical protein
MSDKRRPIFYMEIDFLIDKGSAYYSAATWFISSKINNPDELQSLIRSSQDDYERLLYIAFKKRRDGILKSKATKEDVQITIKSHKQIGYTNGKR